MKNKKLTRTCIGCRAKREKQELIRIVCNKEKKIIIDLSQKAEGRGAYICKSEACFEKAMQKNKLKNSLKTDIRDLDIEKIKGIKRCDI